MNAVEMLNITKRYTGVVANSNVNLIVKKGEIHGLVGENGAGKSTIMNLLYGMDRPNSGTIKVNGKEVNLESPKDAIKLGIGMVHQHFMLAPTLTVLDNIILGKTPKKFLMVDMNKAKEKIRSILDQYSFELDLDAKVFQLSIGQMQRVEIVKALYRGAEILILDEPTAVLTPQEVVELIHIMKQLKSQGCTIIIITHKLKEVLAATDRITVMRKGCVTGVLETKNTNETELANLMVGREVNLKIEKAPVSFKENVLQVDRLNVMDNRGRLAVKNITFHVNKGEILGVCGVEGNGQSELINAITGLSTVVSGTIKVSDKEIQNLSVRKRRENKMSHIPEDRLKVGSAKTCSIKENLILNDYYKGEYSSHGFLRKKTIDFHAKKLISRFSIKVPDSDYALGTLSGGNMQKVILAREIDGDPDILITAQPTRGVDIGAIEYIRKELVKLRDAGKAILLISAELEEIMSLSDRIIVMYEGEIVALFHPDETTEEELGLYMAGAKRMDLTGREL